jgi:hypothetical protein
MIGPTGAGAVGTWEADMTKWAWIDRTFDFDYPAAKFPELLERLRGTPARLEERLAPIKPEVLTASDGKGWSIQENAGHLLIVESLAIKRVGEILAGEPVLCAADMTNRRTVEADHNAKPIATILAGFRRERGALVDQMEQLNESDWGKSALHPRLQQPMRIVDIATFHGEHDDYHLARISELIRALT